MQPKASQPGAAWDDSDRLHSFLMVARQGEQGRVENGESRHLRTASRLLE